jgi:single-strand DNA-binding protein
MSHNLFQFIGNLTRDTEFRQSETSKRAVFDLAVNRTWRDASGEKKEATDFFRIKSFASLAENAGKYLGKGSKVFVQGRIEPTKYEKGDKTEYGFDFIAEQIEYLDTKAPGQGQ